jgi:hypothetical protein
VRVLEVGDDDRARAGVPPGNSVVFPLLEGEWDVEAEADVELVDRLGGSGFDMLPNDLRWEDKRDMARWNGSVTNELGDLLSLPFVGVPGGVSALFLPLPPFSEDDFVGKNVSAYWITGIFKSACMSCVNGATRGGLETGSAVNIRTKGATSLHTRLLLVKARKRDTHGSNLVLHCSPKTF